MSTLQADPRPQDTLTIDPVAMNVTNRVAAGSVLNGDQQFDGGLLVQGTLSGTTRVQGRLIVWAGGVVSGQLVVMGDLYLFGQLGETHGDALATQLECMGTAYVASTAVSTGTLMAQRLRLYEGANLQGPFKTLKTSRALPVLSDELSYGQQPAP